ncbi:hypothetical protein DCS_03817 [Drechmeria coniospora]|uniref:Nuclear protein Es2 n=1 Tax=Drechmeria coniospora TaxID=98403 RepID=A0A151GID5_DRECN|nr:hypothetical protein DCS_03817 [Drechmeria coniospora]KYK56811.1 hypothetical protein DCS_03817 [Drechmeria coniospora]ODA78366.1 hypothetical protein RJ55_05747 [Drechmeria coniospora]
MSHHLRWPEENAALMVLDSPSGHPKALVRKRAETDLMPPPPQVRRIKRPKQVLDEDEYTETLSRIIARDYFPGIEESMIQNEYLDALQSRDSRWISSAAQRLHQTMTPARTRKGARTTTTTTPSASSMFQDGGRTPNTYIGDTPASIASTAFEPNPPLDTNMSLSGFQSTYTSEDNESFYKLIDNQNQKKAEKNAWLWNRNKLPSKQMIKQKEVTDRLEATGNLVDDGFLKRDRLAIKDADDRPARPDSWNANPRNGLMFKPEGLDDDHIPVAQSLQEASRAPPKIILRQNTRMPQPHLPQRPPSPTMSSVRDAIAGKSRQKYQDSSAAGAGETPRVNGYAFVDEDDESVTDQSAAINLGPGDEYSPFKLQEQRKRESLHERLVDRIAKSNKEASRNGLTGKVEKTPVPRFPSSPRVSGGNFTPAAQRLLSKMGTPKRKTPSSSLSRQSALMKPKGSLLRSVTRPSSKQE